MRLVYLFIVLVLAGCNDRRDPPEIRFGPPNVQRDMEGDMAPDAAPVVTSPSCLEKTDGVACALDGAAGVCIAERCALVACEQGFGDCNALAEDGCETRFDVVTSCGGCDSICSGEEACQLGRAGYACTAGISCPRDTFDVDGDLSNGCEVATEWGESISLFAVEPQAIHRAVDRLLVAGTSGEVRVLVEGIRNIDLQAAGPAAGEALAVGTLGVSEGDWIAWPDGVSRVTSSGDTFWQPSCTELEPRDIVGAAVVGEALLVATGRELFMLEPCAEGLCETSRLHHANYLAEFRGRPALPPSLARYAFAAEEFSSCDAACLFDDSGLAAPGACLEGACSANAVDCVGCEPAAANCPDFRPVALSASQVDDDRLYVLTARGVVAIRVPDGQPIFRLEIPYVPGTVSGAQFVDLVAEQVGPTTEHVTLFAADGTLRTLELTGDSVVTDSRPIHAPARLAPEPSQISGFESSNGLLIVAEPASALAVGQVGSAIKAVGLVADTIPGGVVSEVVGTSATASDIEVYYSSPGQLQIRRVFLNSGE